MRRNLERWIDDAPRVECDWDPLKATYRRSLVDLAALRFSPPIAGGRALPAAGLPWFMTMFGRDSIFTSLQALPFTPELAATTLRALGDWQGVRARRLPRRGSGPDPPRDALRGDDRVRGATALAVLRRGRRDAPLHRAARRVRALDGRPRPRPRARDRGARGAQLDRRVRGSPGHRLHLVPPPQRGVGAREPVLEGLVGLDLVPRRRRFRDFRGRRASCRATPTTRRCAAPGSPARSGRTRRSPTSSSATRPISSGASTATSGSRTASTSRSRSTRTDGRSTRSRRTTATCSGAGSSTRRRRRRLPVISSGHASSRAGVCARWPPARAATTRSGTTRAPSGRSTTRSWRGDFAGTASSDEAAEIAAGILDAAEFFDGRLPEAFGGYPRQQTKYPVQYPTACSPQAWSTGTPLLLLRTMLGLEPHGEHLVVDPALPTSIGHLELLDIPGRWGRMDAFGRGRVETGRARARR